MTPWNEAVNLAGVLTPPLASAFLEADARAVAALAWRAFQAVFAVNAALFLLWAYRRYRGESSPFARAWSVVDVWFGAQIILALLVVLVTPLLLLYSAFDPKADLRNLASPQALLYFVLPSSILQNVIFFAVPAAYVTARYGQPLRAIGLPPLPRRRDVAAGLLLGVLALTVSHLLSLGLEALATQFRAVPWVRAALDYERTNPVAQIAASLSKLGVAGLVLAVLGIGIGAPLGEEMLFRGFAFNALKRRFGLAAGLILSAVLFTLPHSYALGLLPVFLLGLLMAWAYHNSGSLWVPIILHATNNTVSVLAAYFFPTLAAS